MFRPAKNYMIVYIAIGYFPIIAIITLKVNMVKSNITMITQQFALNINRTYNKIIFIIYQTIAPPPGNYTNLALLFVGGGV